MKYAKKELLKTRVQHIDIQGFDSRPLVDGFNHMAFQARNLAAACDIYDHMLRDANCTIILCLAGSLISAGLKVRFWLIRIFLRPWVFIIIVGRYWLMIRSCRSCILTVSMIPLLMRMTFEFVI